jgi:hypothetical protein
MCVCEGGSENGDVVCCHSEKITLSVSPSATFDVNTEKHWQMHSSIHARTHRRRNIHSHAKKHAWTHRQKHAVSSSSGLFLRFMGVCICSGFLPNTLLAKTTVGQYLWNTHTNTHFHKDTHAHTHTHTHDDLRVDLEPQDLGLNFDLRLMTSNDLARFCTILSLILLHRVCVDYSQCSQRRYHTRIKNWLASEMHTRPSEWTSKPSINKSRVS